MPESSLDSCIFTGHVMHHRLKPRQHNFRYRTFSLCLDLDELDRITTLKWLSVNRFNLFSFFDKDHGNGQGSLREHINQLLCQRGYASASAHIKLVCYPRILGYVFNPLSVYFCYDKHHQLQVILYEVTNTFHQRHTYLLPVNSSEKLCQSIAKQMYVSPFMPLESRYQFHIRPPQQDLRITINQFDQDEQQLFTASFSGRHQPLTDNTLGRLFLSHPLMTLKVIAGIHWEALQLWRKKLRLQPRQKGRRNSISWYDHNGEHHYESL